MIIYGNMLVCFYSFFENFRGERTAYAYALGATGVSQMFIFAAVLYAINNYVDFDWSKISSDTGVCIVIASVVLWLVCLAQYYTLARLDGLVKQFDDKPFWQQVLWGILSVLSIISVPTLVLLSDL